MSLLDISSTGGGSNGSTHGEPRTSRRSDAAQSSRQRWSQLAGKGESAGAQVWKKLGRAKKMHHSATGMAGRFGLAAGVGAVAWP